MSVHVHFSSGSRHVAFSSRDAKGGGSRAHSRFGRWVGKKKESLFSTRLPSSLIRANPVHKGLTRPTQAHFRSLSAVNTIDLLLPTYVPAREDLFVVRSQPEKRRVKTMEGTKPGARRRNSLPLPGSLQTSLPKASSQPSLANPNSTPPPPQKDASIASSASVRKDKPPPFGVRKPTQEEKAVGKGRWIVVLSRCIVLFFFSACLALSVAEERFGLLTRLGCVFASEETFNMRQMDKYVLAVVVSFGMSFVIDFLGALYSISREKRLLYTLSSSVHLLGGTTKVLLYLNALPVFLDFAGRPLFLIHYLQW